MSQTGSSTSGGLNTASSAGKDAAGNGSSNGNAGTVMVDPLVPANPPAFPARLAVAHINVPLGKQTSRTTANAPSNAYDPGQFDALAEETFAESSNTLSSPISPTLNGSQPFRDIRRDGSLSGHPSQPGAPKRRTLVSLNSFSAMPLGSLSLSGDATRPKTSVKSTSNNFLTRIENAPSSTANTIKSLVASATASAPPNASHGSVTLCFYTQAKQLVWAEIDAQPMATQASAVTKIAFVSYPTALALNTDTLSHTAIDLLVGFSSGDLMWIDPICGKFNRLNKGGCVCNAPVTALTWLPLPHSSQYTGQQQQQSAPLGTFLSAHADGTCVVWSLDKDDPPINLTIFPARDLLQPKNNGLKDVLVERQPIPTSEKKAAGKINPIVTIRISGAKTVTDAAVSPDKRLLAIGCDDGRLRVLDVAEYRLCDTYCSYFGAFTCVRWSPDSRFLLVGAVYLLIRYIFTAKLLILRLGRRSG